MARWSKKFEYKALKTGREDDLEKTLNALGDEGWEVIQLEPHTAAGFHVWLKREK